MPLRRLLTLVALVIIPSTSAADSVTGTATLREEIAPPPDATFVAVLEDISRADAPSVELGRMEITNAGLPPYGFEIDFDPAAIDARLTYSVRATLSAGDRLLFTTDTVSPVLTRGAPDHVELVLRAVAPATTDAGTELPRIGAHGLRLPASFTGTLPCADCAGVAHHLDLWPDQTYHMRREWQGRAGDIGSNRRDELGRWYADPVRGAIVLYGASEMPIQWEVKSPDRLRLLGMDGAPIVSDLPYDIVSDGTLSETDLDGFFMGGIMRMTGDAATFEECLTGHLYPVAQEGDYPALAAAYLAGRAGPGAALYVHVEGGLLMRRTAEASEQRSLVVNRFLKTHPDMRCERPPTNAALTDTYWRIDSLRGQDVAASANRREPHLILRGDAEQRFAATVGCNQMIGSYAREEDRLTFGRVASTMMACPPPLDALERALSETLSDARGYRISGETLALHDTKGEVIAQLTAVYLR